MSEPTIFLVRPHRGGWQAFESPGVEPYYNTQELAISYILHCRTANRFGEIRVLDKGGNVTATIPFDERSNTQRV